MFRCSYRDLETVSAQNIFTQPDRERKRGRVRESERDTLRHVSQTFTIVLGRYTLSSDVIKVMNQETVGLIFLEHHAHYTHWVT